MKIRAISEDTAGLTKGEQETMAPTTRGQQPTPKFPIHTVNYSQTPKPPISAASLFRPIHARFILSAALCERVGATLAKEGVAQDKLHLVVEGELQVSKGAEKIATVRAGEFAGEVGGCVFRARVRVRVRVRACVRVGPESILLGVNQCTNGSIYPIIYCTSDERVFSVRPVVMWLPGYQFASLFFFLGSPVAM